MSSLKIFLKEITYEINLHSAFFSILKKLQKRQLKTSDFRIIINFTGFSPEKFINEIKFESGKRIYS